ncbi:hypothetical protein BC831DRAFT_155351 [Entophlyctis helioformis]|nr:hypothetical protein BC831DRAFT_155351 [Entophlyctis helioformis]
MNDSILDRVAFCCDSRPRNCTCSRLISSNRSKKLLYPMPGDVRTAWSPSRYVSSADCSFLSRASNSCARIVLPGSQRVLIPCRTGLRSLNGQWAAAASVLAARLAIKMGGAGPDDGARVGWAASKGIAVLLLGRDGSRALGTLACSGMLMRTNRPVTASNKNSGVRGCGRERDLDATVDIAGAGNATRQSVLARSCHLPADMAS